MCENTLSSIFDYFILVVINFQVKFTVKIGNNEQKGEKEGKISFEKSSENSGGRRENFFEPVLEKLENCKVLTSPRIFCLTVMDE